MTCEMNERADEIASTRVCSSNSGLFETASGPSRDEQATGGVGATWRISQVGPTGKARGQRRREQIQHPLVPEK